MPNIEPVSTPDIHAQPSFGRDIEEIAQADGTLTLVERSYQSGEVARERVWRLNQIAVNGMMDVFDVIGKSLKQMDKTANHKMTFEVIADHKTLEPIRIERRFQIPKRQE